MRVVLEGQEPDRAKLIVVLLHGRGGSAEDILSLSRPFQELEGVSWLAPQAPGNSWYPKSFLEPRSRNEPYLTLSFESVKGLLEQFEAQRVLLGGFSQGACLASDLLVRTSAARAGAWIFSGGLIGSDDEMPDPISDLAEIPVFLSGSSKDPHVPAERMERTRRILLESGAQVETLHDPEPSHHISEPELLGAGRLLRGVLERL